MTLARGIAGQLRRVATHRKSMPAEYEAYMRRGEADDPFRREAAAAPLYHGSGKRYRDGDLIDPSQPHKKVHPQSDPGKVYFSDNAWNARNWANVASPSGKGHVYEVEPTGHYEEDPHYSGPEERGIYDITVDPIKRINAYQTGHPLRVIRRVPPGD